MAGRHRQESWRQTSQRSRQHSPSASKLCAVAHRQCRDTIDDEIKTHEHASTTPRLSSSAHTSETTPTPPPGNSSPHRSPPSYIHITNKTNPTQPAPNENTNAQRDVMCVAPNQPLTQTHGNNGHNAPLSPVLPIHPHHPGRIPPNILLSLRRERRETGPARFPVPVLGRDGEAVEVGEGGGGAGAEEDELDILGVVRSVRIRGHRSGAQMESEAGERGETREKERRGATTVFNMTSLRRETRE